MARSLCAVAAVLALGSIASCKVDDRKLTAITVTNDGGAVGGATGIVLGTFENDTATPEDHRFAPYQYYSYNPSAPDLPAGAFVSSPLVSPGYNSNFALGLNWEVIDVPDGMPNYPGVGVRTVVATGFVDLSSYDRIVFAQRYQHTGLCQALQTLTVSIGCDELNTAFEASVPVSQTWTNTVMPFSTLAEPSYVPASGHTVTECLALANSLVFQAQVNLSDGDCASGNLALDNIEIRAGGAAADGGQANDAAPSAGIAITPDENGYFDGSNAAGVVGAWWSTGDDYATDGTPGLGSCPLDGLSAAQCSTINTPAPGTIFAPDPTGRGMCTSGTVARVITDSTGQQAFSAIWGNMIAFNLNLPTALDGGPDTNVTTSADVYDAVAHGITGFAFDLDSSVTGMRVEFTTDQTQSNAAYWQGATQDISPVSAPGHYEIRWADIGGPYYLTQPPAFDPSRLQSIRFHIRSDLSAPIPYSYCIKNFVMLTGS